MARHVFYIGYYEDEAIRSFRPNHANCYAATVKMDYILSCLHGIPEQVTLIALAPERSNGYAPLRHWKKDDGVECYLVPSLTIRIFGKNIVRGNLTNFFLARLLVRLVQKDDAVVVYHSLAYQSLFEKLRRRLNFHYVLQVEEVYCLSTAGLANPPKLMVEQAHIGAADGYLFVNDLLARRYGNGKPSVVVYGTYRLSTMPRWDTVESLIRVVYTGSVSGDRDIGPLLDAVPLLPDGYSLSILGVGDKGAIAELMEHIDRVNALCAKQRIIFDGTRRGTAYDAYLSACQIGVSLMTKNDAFEENAFPSKIMTYLCHGLLVVSSRSRCVEESQVRDMVTYCDNTAASIADAILHVDMKKRAAIPERLQQLDHTARDKLRCILQVEQRGKQL